MFSYLAALDVYLSAPPLSPACPPRAHDGSQLLILSEIAQDQPHHHRQQQHLRFPLKALVVEVHLATVATAATTAATARLASVVSCALQHMQVFRD